MNICLYSLDHLNQYVFIVQDFEQLWASKAVAINRSMVELGVPILQQ
jgi:hypothetical protein